MVYINYMRVGGAKRSWSMLLAAGGLCSIPLRTSSRGTPMKILTDEDIYIPDADVWEDMPINGSNWRLVKKSG